MDSPDPELEDALDGLVAASAYCEDVGLHGLSRMIGVLYQRVAIEAPEDDWGTITDEDLRGIGIDPANNESGDELPGFMLPDEREVIAERMGDLDELDEDDRLTVEEVADELGIDLDE